MRSIIYPSETWGILSMVPMKANERLFFENKVEVKRLKADFTMSLQISTIGIELWSKVSSRLKTQLLMSKKTRYIKIFLLKNSKECFKMYTTKLYNLIDMV